MEGYSKVQVRLQRSCDLQACVGFLSLVVAKEPRWLISSYNYVCFYAVALQTKIKFARHNGAQAPLKVVLLSDFHRRVLWSARHHEESNREVGIISSDSYYFFYIITVNENSYVRKLKDMTFFKGVRHGLRILKKYPSYFKFVICSPW